MVRVKLEPLGRSLDVPAGTPLQDVLAAFGVEFPCGGQGRCGGCRVRLRRGFLAVSRVEKNFLAPGEIAAGWRLACCATVSDNITLEVGQWETAVLADHARFAFTPREGLGIAVDLGTTTVVAQLIDLQTGQVLGVRSALNPQGRFGSDVMSRIQAALEGNQDVLVAAARGVVGDLVAGLVEGLEDPTREVAEVVSVGNTVMHHFFCDLDVRPLAAAPFDTPNLGERRFAAADLGWKLPANPPVRFLPCLGGFVGSDVLAGIVATGMHREERPVILIDLGTNGEIVIGNRRELFFASTAAGPAFEGGRISMGMRATAGAIAAVAVQDGRFCCRVLGGVEPRGLCGSGLVDAVAAGLETGAILPSGRLRDNGRPLQLMAPVEVTQQDIRQLQLAKAAISAGLKVLRRRSGLGGDIPIYLAGAFGNYVRAESARRIGLIDAPAECVFAVGNAALRGAKMALFLGHGEDADFSELRRRARHVPLATDPSFQETFIGETLFPVS